MPDRNSDSVAESSLQSSLSNTSGTSSRIASPVVHPETPQPAPPAFSAHRPHRSVPISVAESVQQSKAMFSEAIQTLRAKRMCATEEDSFVTYIKRRMSKFSAQEREQLEDKILDTIRDFENKHSHNNFRSAENGNAVTVNSSILSPHTPSIPLVLKPTSQHHTPSLFLQKRTSVTKPAPPPPFAPVILPPSPTFDASQFMSEDVYENEDDIQIINVTT